MAKKGWPTRRLSVARLFLDKRNPRLGRKAGVQAPREIIQYLFDYDNVLDVADSIATHGYFENEPLLAVSEGGRYVVVEGNRRLAALKALNDPELLQGAMRNKVRRLINQTDFEQIEKVPVVIAGSRRETDRLIVVRHISKPILPWQSENRASFILSKLEEGYDENELHDELTFTEQDIQKARQTTAIAEMARALDLPPEVKTKVDNPRAKLFSTLERVFDSPVGRKFLKIDIDKDHGFRGNTTKEEFRQALSHIVKDIALGDETSRTLNKSEDIRNYFEERNPRSIAAKKNGEFVPDDIIRDKTTSLPDPPPTQKKTKQVHKTVLPKNLRVLFGKHPRLADIRRELVTLNREKFPNAGAVLLRVFLELTIKDYLERTGEMERIRERLPQNHTLKMKQLIPEIMSVAEKRLNRTEIAMVKKALSYDKEAPFSISDLNTFVHHTDFPSERDILQFWNRTEPLFRMMLEQEPSDTT